MIKYLLGAILALAIIGGAFDFKSTDNSWQLIINKKEAFNSVTNGAKRIFNIVRNMIPDSELSEAATIILEEN
ncbi:hypothetical protein OAJ68_00345 [Candidatus Thioglobus sp.]|jgi:hypothetical protein|nr:hypothetical protein [Candidatus Thioglobus sp.]MDC0181454.1 hypothetical protein [Candidatus Thioglobus sp.]MDC0195614.1 hypothetical protein [Candidatus Thioglobus sp.]|tara:strand:- start:368 stop:586 length:219 start_codon:yes stop_codon:yes gene_type:complete